MHPQHVLKVGLISALMALTFEPLHAAVIVETTKFIASPTYFNGFENIVSSPNYVATPISGSSLEFDYYPLNTPYSEGGLTVTYVGHAVQNFDGLWLNGPAPNNGGQGKYGWYPNGGARGYTDIRLTMGGEIDKFQFMAGTGSTTANAIAYRLLDQGVEVSSGIVPLLRGPLAFVGFSGGGFDEVQIQNGTIPFSFSPTNIDTLVTDSFAANPVNVPEPPTLFLLGAGLLGLAAHHASRRRKLGPMSSENLSALVGATVRNVHRVGWVDRVHPRGSDL